MLPPLEARRGDDPGPGGRLKEVNSLTARPTVTLACAAKSSGNLRFMQKFERRFGTRAAFGGYRSLFGGNRCGLIRMAGRHGDAFRGVATADEVR